jgi:hypothetical protein
MKAKLIHSGDLKKWAVVFDAGDEVVEGLKQFAKTNRLSASQLTAIGAFSDCVLGFFKIEQREYKRIPIAEQVEVLSLIGDIAEAKGEPQLHAHVVIGKSDGSAHGGHLISAHVKPTLEIIVTESPRHLQRYPDSATGLALIRLDE